MYKYFVAAFYILTPQLVLSCYLTATVHEPCVHKALKVFDLFSNIAPTCINKDECLDWKQTQAHLKSKINKSDLEAEKKITHCLQAKTCKNL